MMKVNWKEHEMIFVTVLAAAALGSALLHWYHLSDAQLAAEFAPQYTEGGGAFLYWRNVLLPQIGSILLLYGCYLSVNGLILPALKRISFKDIESLASKNVVKAILAIAAVGYLMALGVNVATWYAKPYLFNYGGFQILALLGYNDQPLSNLFFGFERAVGFVLLLTVLAGLREFIIWYIARPGPNSAYKVLIVNNITPLVVLYFLVLIFYNPTHEEFRIYFVCITPVFLLYLYTTFWLFPFKGEHAFTHPPVLIRLLLSTIAGAIPFAFLVAGRDAPVQFLMYLIFLQFIVTPLSWLLYQQRKDKILQLKGMETALASSNASLQFLRSQINPHFLFNALNTLYGTALKDGSEHTATGIQKLGDMMRFMLRENNLDFIPMEREIEYLKNYIDLQKLRTQDSPDIQIEANMSEAKCQHNIAPMLLIPFVENAFKHGISLKEKSWIHLNLECTEFEIHFEVRNSVHPYSEVYPEEGQSGIGLKNVTARLNLLYPEQHTLSVRKEGNEFVVQLTLRR